MRAKLQLRALSQLQLPEHNNHYEHRSKSVPVLLSVMQLTG